jgi:AAA family ATP:ADP antiporter
MFKSINKNTLIAGSFFFCVLYALFVMRPFRSAMAAQIGTSDLTYFLLIVVLVMLFANPIYSLIVSRVKESRLVTYIYGFFILNLFLYAFINNLYPDNYVVGVSFYIWYNVFNFFVVSVFWAKTVNSFQTDDSKKYFGIISAFGSAGAWLGSQSVLLFLADLPVVAMLCASVGLMLGIVLSRLLNSVSSDIIKKGNSGFFAELSEQFIQIKSNKLVRQLLIYAFIWTCLATSLYFFSLEIINKYSTDVVEQRKIFSLADSVVTPISFFTQLFLTRFFLENRFFGIKFVLVAYGALFSIAFFAISGYMANILLSSSGVILFIILSAVMRPFEYAINKPARESVYTTLEKSEKYKSTVFIDTFTNRFGDASGGLLFNTLIVLGLSLSLAPIAIIPLAIYLSLQGRSIAAKSSI